MPVGPRYFALAFSFQISGQESHTPVQPYAAPRQLATPGPLELANERELCSVIHFVWSYWKNLSPP